MARGADDFEAAAKPFLADWESIDLRAILHRGSQGGWILNTLRCVASGEKVDAPVRQDLPTDPELRLVHKRLPISSWEDLLKQVRSGILTVDDVNIDSRPKSALGVQEPELHFQRLGREDAAKHLGLEYASFLLWSSDRDVNEFAGSHVQSLDARLHTADPPWRGVYELRTGFAGVRGWWSNAAASILELIVPLGASLDYLANDENRVSARISLPSKADPYAAVLGLYAQLPDATVARQRFLLANGKFSANGQRLVNSCETHFATAPSKLEGILTYRGVIVDKSIVFGPLPASQNPRVRALVALGLDFGGQLDEAKRGGQGGERSTGRLLCLAGFATLYAGGEKGNMPDVIAFPPSNEWLLVVEHTGRGQLDLGAKVAKLSARTKSLESLTETASYAVLITGSDQMNATDREKAGREAVAVLGPQELREFSELTQQGTTPEMIWRWLKDHVPQGNTPTWVHPTQRSVVWR